MSDLFHEAIPAGYIGLVAEVMKWTPWHQYQVLTKRSERMRDLLSDELRWAGRLENVWWGVSVEDRRFGLPRVRDLQETPAHTRFLSVEPLLEELGSFALDGIDWMIVGGESGPGARAMEPEWVRTQRDSAIRQKVPFFFKQWGGVRKGTTGRTLDGRTWDEFPAEPLPAAPPLSLRRQLMEGFAEALEEWERVREQNAILMPFRYKRRPGDRGTPTRLKARRDRGEHEEEAGDWSRSAEQEAPKRPARTRGAGASTDGPPLVGHRGGIG